MSTHSSPTKKCRVDGGCVPATPPSLTKSSRENESPANGPHSGKNSPGDDSKEPRISNGSSVPDEDARVSESSNGDAPLDVETVAEEARGRVAHGDDEEVRRPRNCVGSLFPPSFRLGRVTRRSSPHLRTPPRLTSTPRPPTPQDESLKLARMLQEQERAYYMLQHRLNSPTAGRHPEDVRGLDEDTQYRFEGDDGVAEGDDAETPPAAIPAAGADEDESVRLARELMAEEQRVFQARMLEWAGMSVNPDTGDVDDDDEGVDVEAMTYEELTALGEQIGTQSKGLAPEVVDALPVRRYCAGTAGCEEEKCMICLTEFEEDDEAARVPKCGHEFHRGCLTPWLSDNKCCPICKTEIDAGEVLKGAEGASA